MKHCGWILLLLFNMAIYSCSQKVRLLKGDGLSKYIPTQTNSAGKDSTSDTLEICILSHFRKTDTSNKSTYYFFKKFKPRASDCVMKVTLTPNDPIPSDTSWFYPSPFVKKALRYGNGQFGLQALSIPLKFRGAIGNGSLYPANVETGANLALAPFYKFNLNSFNPRKKILDKPTQTLSLSLGLLGGIGAEQLKAATNAPNIKPDRQSGMYSYGSFCMIGFNNINIGYAIGADHVFGGSGHYWVYQNKLWQGITIGLDILK